MAQNFRNQLVYTAIGTSPVDILAQADTYDTVVGIRLVNVAASAINVDAYIVNSCLLYTSPSPRDATLSRMPSSA